MYKLYIAQTPSTINWAMTADGSSMHMQLDVVGRCTQAPSTHEIHANVVNPLMFELRALQIVLHRLCNEMHMRFN